MKIKLDHVSVKFGDLYAVKDISMTIDKGEYVTILGPSGCGKTTLIKIVSGILRPTEGRVFVDGEDVTDVPIEDRDTGYVFQNIALFPHMTISDNVGYGPRVRDLDSEAVTGTSRQYLELVNMLERAGMMPNEISGGEQQKVAIARALASGSKMLMLDEPLSALDARVRMELRYEIRRLVKKLGITVLHVTHDQEEAMSVSDRMILMRNGGIAETSTPLDMYRRPETIFSAYFVGETNFLECTVVGKTKTGKTTVRLRNDTIVRVAKSKFNVGDPVVISVRPEHVYTASDGLPATVRNVVFMGTYWRIRTLSATDDYIEYNIPADDDIPELGDEVFLVFNKKATLVFARPSEGLEEAIRLE
ncbi:MAG: ABC transporter ATP-binding protein [Candidatus Methanomethylophilaceae archaeon]|jgi:ABC-type Fe3+/spermidine/putrescine transport system ATPase subunit|nr:ABC transporter ATP-binding protein [Candidatus Methanomethylophilaceae archaeon]NLF33505.1 ABC transporter ATP-binding protein [Thermoplasmatales archaeon]